MRFFSREVCRDLEFGALGDTDKWPGDCAELFDYCSSVRRLSESLVGF